MENEGNLELQKKDSHHSQDTEKIEKMESDNQSAGSKKEEKFEKIEKIDNEANPPENLPEKQSNNNEIQENQNNNDPEAVKIESKPKENDHEEVAKSVPQKNVEEEQKNEIPKEKEKELQNIEEKVDEIEKKKVDESEEKKIAEIEDKKTDEKEEKKIDSELKDANKQEDLTDEANNKILEKMPIAAMNLFVSSAEKKKNELEHPPEKPKKKPKKKLLSEEENEILQRKKARFSIVRNWDNERSKALNLQISLVDKLLVRLDQKIRISNSSWLSFIQFFKERMQQESEYMKSLAKANKIAKSEPKKPLKEGLEDPNGKTQDFTISMEAFMVDIDMGHLMKSKKVEEFVTFIDKNLINEKIKVEFDNQEKEIAKNKKQIENLKKNLSETNMQTTQKAKLYSKMYSEMINDEDYEISEKKDLFIQELSFVTTARKQSRSIQELLIEVLKLIQTFIGLEKKKIEVFKNVLEQYFTKYTQVHGPEVFSDLQKKIPLIDCKEIDQNCSIQYFVNKEDLIIFKKEFESHESFQNFLQNEYKIIELPEENSLINGKFKVFVKSQQTYENSWVIFTGDKNLAIFKVDTEELVFDIHHICLKANAFQVYQKDTKILELTQTIPGLIFNTKKTLTIKSEEEKEINEILKMLNKKV